MLAEREHLLPLAAEGFDLAALHFPRSTRAAASGADNFYSTPLPVGTTVEAKVYSAYVEIWHGGHCVAQHERCYGTSSTGVELDHYLNVLQKKPGAMAGSTALEQCRAQGRWPAATTASGESPANGKAVRLARGDDPKSVLSRTYGAARVRQAVEEALLMGTSS